MNAVQFGLRLVGSQNVREHWRARARRVKEERATTKLCCELALTKPKSWPVVVKLTRIGPRKLDSDNVSGCLKAVRDQVAVFLGVDDGDESKVTWSYAQERGPYGVRVEIVDEVAQCERWKEAVGA